jgi:hypothetical protein
MNLPAYRWLASTHDERVHGARRYSARQAWNLVLSAGFADVRVRHWNGFLFPLMLVHRLTSSGNGTASDVRDYPGWQNRLLLAIMMAEHRLGSIGIRFPFGGSIQVEARK